MSQYNFTVQYINFISALVSGLFMHFLQMIKIKVSYKIMELSLVNFSIVLNYQINDQPIAWKIIVKEFKFQ